MEQDVTQRLEPLIEKRVKEMWDAFSQETMRGKILVLTTQIDNLLLDMFKRFFKPPRTKDKQDELFGKFGPLNSFAAHIEMGYRLGLVSKEDADALDRLRKIRNDCAHSVTAFSLEVEPHSSWFADFVKRTCEKDNRGLLLLGALCPQSCEDFVMWTCMFHVVELEMILATLEQTPDKFTRPLEAKASSAGS